TGVRSLGGAVSVTWPSCTRPPSTENSTASSSCPAIARVAAERADLKMSERSIVLVMGAFVPLGFRTGLPRWEGLSPVRYGPNGREGRPDAAGHKRRKDFGHGPYPRQGRHQPVPDPCHN